MENPHTNIIHKVMPFKTTFFSADNKQRYFFETDTIVECVWNLMAHDNARERKWRGNWPMEWVASTLTLPRNVVYPALLTLMCTPRLPAVDWNDSPTDLNGLARFSKTRNLVSARLPSGFKRTIAGGTDLRPMSAPLGALLTAFRRCVDYPLRPASLCLWLCPKEKIGLLSVTSIVFELARFSGVQRFWYLCSLRCVGRGNHVIVSF